METPAQPKETFNLERDFEDQVCHICDAPFTHSLCGVFRGNHVLLNESDLPDCPICAVLSKHHAL